MTDEIDPDAAPAADDATFSMFGEDETGPPSGGYQVLARKYRPRRFEDLIGQQAMVRTLGNAFETGRIAHAFMLTGVRGVGKTTTARLLARALNHRSDERDGPSIRLDPPGEHCQAIMESRHPDVLELDAASRTGVADMRELLDGVRYAPVSARYKVYIIDEVHMLSTAAFNALLKTLEEPPSHVKFIFATTEIRKVPVTVLSRCQRFDLKRLDVDGLSQHLARVCAQEGAAVAGAGLAMIARAAEGSVRDALSILDQAIVQNPGEVSAAAVRDMLGLGDRARLLDLFDTATEGDAKSAAGEVIALISDGADPLVLLKDLLDICADVATVQATGEEGGMGAPPDWAARTAAIANRLSPAQAARYWRILLTGYQDAQTAPEADTAARMVVLRLAAAAALPSPEDAARLLVAGGASPARAGPEAGAGDPQKGPASFAEIVALMDARREAILSGEASDYVRPIRCRPGELVCALEPGGPPDLLHRIAQFLETATGAPWSVRLGEDAAGSETMKARRRRVQAERIAAAADHPAVRSALALFPNAELVDVRQEAPADAASDNVVEMPPPAQKGRVR